MEALIGVVIVCVIGNLVAITILIVEHLRWRKEFKLHYLRTEQIRREEQCDKIREQLNKGLEEDVYPFEFMIELFIRLPDKVADPIAKAWRESDLKDDEGKRKLYRNVSLILGKYLSKIEKQIEEITQ